jgi:hypothetical protein
VAMAKEQHFGDVDRPKWGAEDPFAGQRPDPHGDRLAQARLAREIAKSQALSGTHQVDARTRTFDPPEDLRSSIRRDAAGRLVIDWAKASDVRDEGGRFAKPERYQG